MMKFIQTKNSHPLYDQGRELPALPPWLKNNSSTLYEITDHAEVGIIKISLLMFKEWIHKEITPIRTNHRLSEEIYICY